MEYTALYRKFRPTTFSEMVGQEHITRTLKNQIIAGRVGHAYLFNGGRGTGKTSAAKILARAINCLNPKDGEPCNECEVCKAMLEGTLTDVVEMDAASNNSVEDIRSIREEVNFLPTVAKYRVYIIDEVHMLSTGAFNALLKTLEEPPEHVKFILATTEPQKLPATILSRCQRFDFKKISNENIIKRLKKICKDSDIEISEEALKLIATISEGAMRDSISILERCVQDNDGKIEEEKIRELVGIPKVENINKITDSIISKNPTEALNVVNSLIEEGKDANNLLWEIIKYVKDVLIYKTTNNLEIYNKEEIGKIKDLSEKTSQEALLKLIYNLSELENDMKWSSQKLIMLQAGIIKNSMEIKNDNLEERVEKLEKQLASGVLTKPAKTQVAESIKSETKKEEKKETIKKPQEIIQTNPGEYAKYWDEVVSKLKKSGKIVLYTNLINTKAKPQDNVLEVEFKNKITAFAKTVLSKQENISEIESVVKSVSGKDFRIKYVENIGQNVVKTQEQNINNLDIPINIIEE